MKFKEVLLTPDDPLTWSRAHFVKMNNGEVHALVWKDLWGTQRDNAVFWIDHYKISQ